MLISTPKQKVVSERDASGSGGVFALTATPFAAELMAIGAGKGIRSDKPPSSFIGFLLLPWVRHVDAGSYHACCATWVGHTSLSSSVTISACRAFSNPHEYTDGSCDSSAPMPNLVHEGYFISPLSADLTTG
ncbi:hypothetical protein J6590_103575 [Homalodisca vitripennis]|nr:hypothetical protein J6590_103575 [Homalodisca vitripennis]